MYIWQEYYVNVAKIFRKVFNVLTIVRVTWSQAHNSCSCNSYIGFTTKDSMLSLESTTLNIASCSSSLTLMTKSISTFPQVGYLDVLVLDAEDFDESPMIWRSPLTFGSGCDGLVISSIVQVTKFAKNNIFWNW